MSGILLPEPTCHVIGPRADDLWPLWRSVCALWSWQYRIERTCNFDPWRICCRFQPMPNKCGRWWPGEYGEFSCEVPQ